MSQMDISTWKRIQMRTWDLIASTYKLSDESGSIEGAERPHGLWVNLCDLCVVNQNRTNMK